MRSSAGWCALAALIASQAVCADDARAVDELCELSLEELSTLKVSIASGAPLLLHEAPAVASIITARELEAMGSQDLDEALESVPGLHVSHGGFAYASRYFIRGIVSNYNPQTLVLVNGIPRTRLFLGDRSERQGMMSGFPVQMIERIEIIRGPGSALYGADAFAGVINIITRRAEDMQGGQALMGRGSFDATRASLIQAGDLGPVSALLSLAYSRSDGDRPVIDTDLQTNLDAMLGTSASLAPGTANLASHNFDVRTELAWRDYRVRLAWRRAEAGVAQGVNDSLDPDGFFVRHHGTVDVTWHDMAWRPDWDLEAQASYLYSDFRTPVLLKGFPPGAFGQFPEGILAKPELSEENARLSLTALHTGLKDHRLRVGAGFYWGDIFQTRDVSNYFATNMAPTPRPALTDISDSADIFVGENQRTNWFGFVQDEWALHPRWELTTGVRVDGFSDVGRTVNPRLALVWQSTPTLTSKLLYGEAFRAPSFFELYGKGTWVALGNPDLEPEKLKSLELAFNWRPEADWTLDFNLYALRIRDYIDFISDPGATTFTARNIGEIHGEGLEAEWRYQASSRLQLLANYSLQWTENSETGTSMGLTPKDKIYLRAAWTLSPRWQLTPQLTWQGDTERPAGDTRATLHGYATADLTVRYRPDPDLELSLVGRNLFDADVREASRGPSPGQVQSSLLHDLPQEGRSVLVQARVDW